MQVSRKYSQGIIARIDSEVDSLSLLKHPFYQLWSCGSLKIEHLQGYSKEYFHLVTSIPMLVENIMSFAETPSDRASIGESLGEEQSHIEMWEKFANGIGVTSEELRAHTFSKGVRQAVSEMESLTRRSLEEGAAAMYAYELELPRISRSKIDGLSKYYGIKSPGTLEYFNVHETVDIKHAAVWREIIRRVPVSRQEAVYEAAKSSLIAQNRILDSIQEAYVN